MALIVTLGLALVSHGLYARRLKRPHDDRHRFRVKGLSSAAAIAVIALVLGLPLIAEALNLMAVAGFSARLLRSGPRRSSGSRRDCRRLGAPPRHHRRRGRPLMTSRTSTPLIQGLAIAASAIPASLLAAYLGQSFVNGFDGLIIGLALLGGFCLSGMIITPALQGSGTASLPEYLAHRFGAAAGHLALAIHGRSIRLPRDGRVRHRRRPHRNADRPCPRRRNPIAGRARSAACRCRTNACGARHPGWCGADHLQRPSSRRSGSPPKVISSRISATAKP